MSEYYLSYTGAQLDDAVNKVMNRYVNPEDFINHCTQSASGTIAGSGQTCDKLSIGLNFRAKIIFIIATTPVTTSNTGSPYEISSILRVYDNEYSGLRNGCVFVYKSGNNVRTGYSTSNGVSSNSDNTITGWGASTKFASGVTYEWYAWG